MSWRHTSEYRRWQKAVVKRDKVCQIPMCKETHHLHSHHMNHSTYFIEQRFWVRNGIALCGDCHVHFHCSYKSSTREKCTKKDWLNFLELGRWYEAKFHEKD